MNDRPLTVSCVDCGGPVLVKPSGRIPIRHTLGCPQPTVASVSAVPSAPVETMTNTEVPAPADDHASDHRPLEMAVQIAPYRWRAPSGEIVDGNGRPM